jgi:hypothetical protein
MFCVPLIGQLSNRHFLQKLDNLGGLPLAAAAEAGELSDVRALCRCGCGERVTAHRKLVNQDHYTAWLRKHWPSAGAERQ